ncbi:unnamed protein product [Meganyctiphanes norvegica]|uniref:Uncharacterized protein n=1 Tax=Meganyctiphanes norvegica TaxID=48144 RepID=A0AAV2Q624_MEGNR
MSSSLCEMRVLAVATLRRPLRTTAADTTARARSDSLAHSASIPEAGATTCPPHLSHRMPITMQRHNQSSNTQGATRGTSTSSRIPPRKDLKIAEKRRQKPSIMKLYLDSVVLQNDYDHIILAEHMNI